VQPLEFISPAFYLDKLCLRLVGVPNLDRLAGVVGPSAYGGPALCLAVLAGVTILFAALAIRRLARIG